MHQRATAISHQILWSDGLKPGESYVRTIGWCQDRVVSEGGGRGCVGRCTVELVLWIRRRSIGVPDSRRTSVDQIAFKMKIGHELTLN